MVQEQPPAPIVERVVIHPEAAAKAVFVDQSGRRGRALRGFGWIAGVACAGFAATALTTVAGSNAQAPAMPVPSPTANSAVLGESGTASPSPSPAAAGATGRPSATGKPTGRPSATGTGAAATGTAKPTGTPKATPSGAGAADTTTTSAKPGQTTPAPGARAASPHAATSAAKPR